jgi:hypothetical protein
MCGALRQGMLLRSKSTGFLLVLWSVAVACSSPTPSGKDRTPKLTEDATEADDKGSKESAKKEPAADDRKAPTAETTNPPASGADAGTPTPTPPAAPTFPRAAADGECKVGDGLYCAGNGVEGVSGTLYRCNEGTISEEKKCGMSCLFMRDGINDACDGDVAKCPYGNGLYCGQNGLSGDTKTLYRCTNGSVTIEETCATTCVNEAIGIADRCE